MIYITGDTHGDACRFSSEFIDNEERLTKDDIVIVCGDFGMIFYPKSDHTGWTANNKKLDCLSKKPYTILFIDGNHENFDELLSYPEITMFGNKVHKIRNNIFHLERGRIYIIHGKTFFTFGGAYSVDKYRRQEHISWWKQELPDDKEYRRGINSLKEAKHKVDYIITHTAPKQVVLEMGYYPIVEDSELTGYLDWVMYETVFNKWYFGHFHEDKELRFGKKYNFHALYYDTVKIE